MLRGMAGQPALPACETCGGLPMDSDAPLKGKCHCQNDPALAHADKNLPNQNKTQ